jgi:hypothetical protein
MTGTADAKLYDGEILVVQIQPKGTFILTIVAKHRLGSAHEVERNRKATKQRYAVVHILQEPLGVQAAYTGAQP